MVSGSVNPVNEIHAFPRERENIFYRTYARWVEIVWHFAFCAEWKQRKKEKEKKETYIWYLKSGPTRSFAFPCLFLFSFISDIGKLSSLCISEIKNSHFPGERYSRCRILGCENDECFASKDDTWSVGKRHVFSRASISVYALSAKRSFQWNEIA